MATPVTVPPSQARPAPATVSGDVERFITGNRIHIKDGSLFLDPYLVVHPRELAPGNEATLREKLKLTYSLNNPSFYESATRLPIALNLASLLPVSLGAKRTELLKTIDEFNQQVKSNTDPDLAKIANDRARPFAAIARDYVSKPDTDAVGMETLKGGLTFYLVLREALTRKGYLNRLTDYVRHDLTADQILSALEDKTGVASETVMEAARTGGLAGVANALGIEQAYLNEVHQVVERASAREFSYNLIEHWHIGRQLLTDRPAASLDDKIAVGMERRLHDTTQQLRAHAKNQTDVPASIKETERWVADGLKLLPPIQRQLLWDLGYEIGYTNDHTADRIAYYPGVLGLHRQTKDNMSDLRGTYRIYFGSNGDIELARRTLVHEVTHNLWPTMFNDNDVKQIDALANQDRVRLKTISSVFEKQFDTFKGFTDAYHAAGATAQQKQDALAAANRFFGSTLGNVSALITENKDAFEVLHMTQHANDRLQIDGKLFKRSGYHEPQSRFREVLSRFSELRYVRLREQPALMDFIAPGLSQVYDHYYLPHLERLHTRIVTNNAQIAAAPGTRIAASNDNVVAGAVDIADQPKTEVPRAQGGSRQDASGIQDAPFDKSKEPTRQLMGGLGAGAERNLAALQTLKEMGVRV